jgi:hypothetical protein
VPKRREKSEQEKICRKPRVLMGFSLREGEDETAKAGGVFDPRMFKGNIQLEKHFNECALSMIPSRKIPPQSDSYKMNKKPGQSMKKAPPNLQELQQI